MRKTAAKEAASGAAASENLCAHGFLFLGHFYGTDEIQEASGKVKWKVKQKIKEW